MAIEEKGSLTLPENECCKLQNILLRMQLENEKITNNNLKIEMSKNVLKHLENDLNIWNKNTDEKLQEVGLSIANVEIDAENGTIKPLTALKALG